MPAANNALQGTLDLLVLKSLAQLGAMHGFGIALHIQQISKDVLRVEEGSLYPALRRIENSGWIISEWDTTDNNRRAKYYRLTALGKRQLAHEERNWAELVSGVNALLRYA
jgi:PadR family transcriptional regulator, regulatory protein PadR